MKIITSNLNEKCPVYHKYPRQFNPQPAYIELDCRGEGVLSADFSGEIGNGVPFYVGTILLLGGMLTLLLQKAHWLACLKMKSSSRYARGYLMASRKCGTEITGWVDIQKTLKKQ